MVGPAAASALSISISTQSLTAAMAHALTTFDGADMKPDVRALFTNASVPYELGPLIAALEHGGDSTKCDGLNVEHLVDMNFGEFAKSPLTYANSWEENVQLGVLCMYCTYMQLCVSLMSSPYG